MLIIELHCIAALQFPPENCKTMKVYLLVDCHYGCSSHISQCLAQQQTVAIVWDKVCTIIIIVYIYIIITIAVYMCMHLKIVIIDNIMLEII